MESQPGQNQDLEQVSKLMGRFVRKHMFMTIVSGDATANTFVVRREDALEIGITPTGEIPDSVEESRLDELMQSAIDPSLN